MNVTAPTESPIPSELRELSQWVVYRAEPGDDGKTSKRPYQARHTRNLASSTNGATWASFAVATEAAARDRSLSGVGFVFTTGDPYCGVDLDHCIADGVINARAQRIMDALDSYSEYSPSGDGIHIIVRATLPRGHKNDRIEMYSSGRYFTMPGRHVLTSPLTINERQSVVDGLIEKYFPAPEAESAPPPRRPNSIADNELLQRGFAATNGDQFRALYTNGDKSRYGGDDSAADLALCNYLAFWTGNDPARMDSLFRASALYRKKWDERHGALTYGRMTIDKAIAATRETYSPPGAKHHADTGSFGRNGATPEPDPETGEPGERESLFVWASDLDGIPEQEWVIEHLAPKDALCAIVGGFGAKKTFVLLDMACCIATGKPWHGREVQQGSVVYIYSEGLKGLRKRLRAWDEENHKTVTDIAFVPRAIRMLDPVDLRILVESIKNEITPAPSAIFIDTLARSMAGGDENNQKDMGLLVDAADRLRRETGASVWFAHHMNRTGEYRGSSALPGALDVMIGASVSGNVVTLHCEKLKDEEAFDDVKLLAKQVGQSLVLVSTNDFDAAQQTLEGMTQDAKEAFYDLAAFGAEGASWHDWLVRTELEKTAFNHALNALKRAKLVSKNDTLGTWQARAFGGSQ